MQSEAVAVRVSEAVRLAVLVTSGLAVLEFILVVNDVDFPSKLFALAFLVSLALRASIRSHRDAARWWWPVEWVLLFWIVKDQWVYRVIGKNPVVQAIKAHAMRNPLWAIKTIPKALRTMRWIKWFAPFWGAAMQIKNALERYWILHRQRMRRRRQKRVVGQLARLRSPAESETVRLLSQSHPTRCAPIAYPPS